MTQPDTEAPRPTPGGGPCCVITPTHLVGLVRLLLDLDPDQLAEVLDLAVDWLVDVGEADLAAQLALLGAH